MKWILFFSTLAILHSSQNIFALQSEKENNDETAEPVTMVVAGAGFMLPFFRPGLHFIWNETVKQF